MIKFGDKIYSKNIKNFSGLYEKLGIPSEPLKEIRKLSESLTKRKFVICHSDIHRKNCILHDNTIYYLDWELSLFADPAYEIAVHLHKISYTPDEEKKFKKLLNELLNNFLLVDENNFWNDVSIYLKLEKVKSVIVDAIRYYKQINFENISDNLQTYLTKKYSFKLSETQDTWKNPILSPNEILTIMKTYKI